MGFPGYKTQAYETPDYLKTTSTNSNRSSVPSEIAALYGFGTGVKDVFGKEQDPIGYPAVTPTELRQTFDINNPYQVGARQFDSSAFLKTQILRPAKTVFTNPTSGAATVTPYTPIKGS